MASNEKKSLAERMLDVLPGKNRKEALLLIFMMSGFVFLVLTLIFTYHLSAEHMQTSPVFGPLVSYHVEFMVTIAALGLAVGAGAFYLLSGMLEKKGAEVRWNANLLLKFLNDDERAVVRLVLERKGSIYQSEIAMLDGMGKVRAHRVVERLRSRGVVEVRRVGKINLIQMPSELMDGLSNEVAQK
ncbi:MAG: hypothetical protein V1728_04515 [Candidatus Micrarchaeota archaeon]